MMRRWFSGAVAVMVVGAAIGVALLLDRDETEVCVETPTDRLVALRAITGELADVRDTLRAIGDSIAALP